MMKKFYSLLSLLLTLVVFLSCEPNDNNTTNQNDDTFAQNFGSEVVRDFIGQVIDIDKNPIQGVNISIGTSTVQTDVNGVFIINGATVYQKFAHITAAKSGYTKGSRTIVPTMGKNNVKIMLLPNAPLETIQSGVESEVSIYSGAKVKFKGGFQDENGTNYSGPVQVSLFHLTPTDENIDKLMPGMLYGQRENNEQAVLDTYGMLNVELRGSAGQKLNIKDGQTADITMRIDDSQLATAPSSIPLWHFDEEKGYWKEDGVATKVGNNYVGKVSHFSWWNCDIPNSSIYLTFTFVDSAGNPLSNLALSISNPSGNFAHGTTDANGQVSGFFPVNQLLTLNIYAINLCGINNTIGPFTQSGVVPNIVVDNSSIILKSKITGRMLRCDDSNVTNGYVLLNQNGNYAVSPVTNGNFSFNQYYCPGDTNFSLVGFDYDNFQQTGVIAYDFKATTFVGNIKACNAITEFVSFQVDNQQPVFYTNELYSGYEFFYPTTNPYGMNFKDLLSSPSFSLWIRYQQPGFYPDAMFTANSGPSGFINSEANGILFDFTISKSGQIGQYIDLTFDGTYYDANNVIRRLRGTVHAIRKY